MSYVKPNPRHEIAYQDVCSLLQRHAGAVASNMIGKLVALQDQRTMTKDRAMETVARNLELGNQQALDELTGKTAGSA